MNGKGGFTIYWRIENFNSDIPNNFCVKSEVILSHSIDSCWQILNKVGKGSLGTFIQKKDGPSSFHFSVSYLSSSGWVTVVKDFEQTFSSEEHYKGAHLVHLYDLSKNQWDYLPNGSLTVSFHLCNDHIKHRSVQCLLISRIRRGNSLQHKPMQWFNSLKPKDMLSFPINYDFCPEPKQDFSTDYARLIQARQSQINANIDYKDLQELFQLFREKKFSFVTLRTQKKDFSVHKAVLCAKSPVFKAMFENKMKESDSNIVDIDDVDSEIISVFIKFLHFEPLGDLTGDSVEKLYYAADKYQIESLKRRCVSLLKKQLTVENICDVLTLADLHQEDDLMKCAQEYFCKNFKTILPSSRWRDLLSNTELVANLLCKLAETM